MKQEYEAPTITLVGEFTDFTKATGTNPRYLDANFAAGTAYGLLTFS